MNDEIMTDLHGIKDAISEEFHFDMRALFEDIKRGEAELRATGVRLVPPPADPEKTTYTTLQRTRFARR
uniref:Uncharacterized protein n=3 Tax=unclassified Candidatus Kentrum TaxID=2643149 RepID=A0A450YAG8_9GAMM|nr:MAG: hypothetical protein BECKLPF1236A_GA0070988_1000218 [Candidatus Kentron sp. LPFa]VFK36335.1 MAG: hypothetical protein BECKSD772F_GA0070984_10019 [Candidatus Kentron sp. SD]VFK65116.1 MAG: hypothetical protein BECKUNK1418G_GA0071005_105711 [Candidatus Kentron sp. UNK]VFK22385.1 MAG: hypothetical protein BECKLPF1236B_GA0070989_13073 [Candidatus Kentron sp. LPFa]VFK23567.1 MAG: hypothetical protein BECKLPF1236C_GA0070990_1000625 [Candidatus Kentron sp. LPFa]